MHRESHDFKWRNLFGRAVKPMKVVESQSLLEAALHAEAMTGVLTKDQVS